MKKILSLFLLIFSFVSIFNTVSANKCEFNNAKGVSVTSMIDDCMADTTVVAVKDDGTIEVGFKNKINKWTNNIALFLGLLSIGAVIYGGLMMTLSTGEDEKIKKAKDIVKWALIGLLGVILATTIVTLLINVIYGLQMQV